MTTPSAGLIAWLARGERGVSGDTMVTHITGIDTGEPWPHHPYDPDDLRRCRLLIEQAPEIRDGFAKMATFSPQWAALVARWDELCALMDDETPHWRERRGYASRTYDLMQEIIDDAEAGR